MANGADATDILAWLADDAGAGVAERLQAAAGGTRIWVPAEPNERHKLTRLVGIKDARAIARVLGEGLFTVPNGVDRKRAERKAAIERLTRQGVSANDIAQVVGCHVRSVYRARASSDRR